MIDEAASSETEQVFNAISGYPTSAPGAAELPYHVIFNKQEMHFLEPNPHYRTWGGMMIGVGLFVVNEDLNITINADSHAHANKKYLVLTDQLMNGVLTIRDVTGQ